MKADQNISDDLNLWHVHLEFSLSVSFFSDTPRSSKVPRTWSVTVDMSIRIFLENIQL